jgi:hypothetical protein
MLADPDFLLYTGTENGRRLMHYKPLLMPGLKMGRVTQRLSRTRT